MKEMPDLGSTIGVGLAGWPLWLCWWQSSASQPGSRNKWSSKHRPNFLMLIKLVDHLLSVRFGPDVIEAFSPKHEGKNYERALFIKAATLKLLFCGCAFRQFLHY